jgi:IclR family pca regulon transcriptional regulator
MKSPPARPKYFSESLARGLRVISAFDHSGATLRISEVAKRTGLIRAAARRYLLTLQDLGFVGSNQDRFFLRPRVLQLGFSYFSSVNVDHVVQPFLNDLAEKTRETSSFAVLEGPDVMFIARAASKKVLSFTISIGGRVPTHSTALGYVLLAGLPPEELEKYIEAMPKSAAGNGILGKKALRDTIRQVRKQGWAGVDGRNKDGINSIAVPVTDRTGTTTAAMNIMQYPGKDTISELAKQYLATLRESAVQVGTALDASGHFALSARRPADSAPPKIRAAG